MRLALSEEVTLERQAFEAELRIDNGLPVQSIENFAAVVHARDELGRAVGLAEDPADTNGVFFMRLDVLQGIEAVDGSGHVAPGESARMRWTLIPSPGAAGGSAAGAAYDVGATISYRIGDAEYLMDVVPDRILVEPMPDLRLDLFLARNVQGDDPLTAEEEPSVPFTLGVRALNRGPGAARAMRIEAQAPRIVSNHGGLAVDFSIVGCEVDGVLAADTLNATLGDVAAGAAACVRWFAVSSLSGTCSDFSVSTRHADALGGAVTALLRPENVHRHALTRDVLVDLPGADTVRDFLCEDGMLYGSDGRDAAVSNVSEQIVLAALDEGYEVSVPTAVGGWMHAAAAVTRDLGVPCAVRADGKVLPGANVWVTRLRGDDGVYERVLHLFDYVTGPTYYRVTAGEKEAANRPPVVTCVAVRQVAVGDALRLEVHGEDPDGDAVALTCSAVPAGGLFRDLGGGCGRFDWTPRDAQAGTYVLRFGASDGDLSDGAETVVTVLSAEDAARRRGTVIRFR